MDGIYGRERGMDPGLPGCKCGSWVAIPASLSSPVISWFGCMFGRGRRIGVGRIPSLLSIGEAGGEIERRGRVCGGEWDG